MSRRANNIFQGFIFLAILAIVSYGWAKDAPTTQVLGVLALVSMIFGNWRDVMFFAVGVVLGGAMEIIYSAVGVVDFASKTALGCPVFVLLFGGHVALVIRRVVRELEIYLEEYWLPNEDENSDGDEEKVLPFSMEIYMVVAVFASTLFLYKWPWSCASILTIFIAIRLAESRMRGDPLLMAAAGVAAFLISVLLIWAGLCKYPYSQILGVPVWLPLYFAYVVTFIRRLFLKLEFVTFKTLE